jgi:glutathione synthase/RimK-type ligase-like ATP-grasp enzyme
MPAWQKALKSGGRAALYGEFDTEFVPRHTLALQEIYDKLGLDYVGIDCGETPDGKLLIFEVDSDMIVHAMDPVEMFPYKQATMKIVCGIQRLVNQARIRFNIERAVSRRRMSNDAILSA